MGWLTNYSGYVHRLRQEYVSPRKNKGTTLDSFLSQKFEYLAVSALVTRPAIPVSRVGDADVLREQNISLNREIDDTNDRLTSAEKKCRLLTRDRDAAKRKADRKATNYEKIFVNLWSSVRTFSPYFDFLNALAVFLFFYSFGSTKWNVDSLGGVFFFNL